MCTVLLQIAGTALGAYGQYQQGKAQEEAYKAQSAAYTAQANAADQNAKIANRQQESIADAYAEKQAELRQRQRVVAGQQAAAFGARGLEGGSGSALDLLAGSYEGYQHDTRNLLTNQQNDIWGKAVEETNFLNEASAARASASAADASAGNARKAGTLGALTTLVSGAATTSAYSDKWKKIKTPGTLKIGG